MRRTLLTLALLTSTTFGTACMGKFVLTKGLYKFNETVTGSKLVNNVIFWALLILPVYELATLGDALIFNLIEFWTGSNLLAAVDGQDPANLKVVHNGETFTATRVDARTVIVRRGSLILGTVEITEAGIVISGPDGVEQMALPSSELEAMAPAMQSLR